MSVLERQTCAVCDHHVMARQVEAPCWPFTGWLCSDCGQITLTNWGSVWSYVFFLPLWWNGTVHVCQDPDALG